MDPLAIITPPLFAKPRALAEFGKGSARLNGASGYAASGFTPPAQQALAGPRRATPLHPPRAMRRALHRRAPPKRKRLKPLLYTTPPAEGEFGNGAAIDGGGATMWLPNRNH